MIPVTSHAEIIRPVLTVVDHQHQHQRQQQQQHQQQQHQHQQHQQQQHQQHQQHQHQQQMYASRPSSTSSPSSAWENYGWLFDDSLPDQLVMELNHNSQMTYLHPLEAQYYGNAIDAASSGKGGSSNRFHPLDEAMRSQVLILVGDAPNLHSGNVGMAAMQRYLRLYWTEFHPAFPLLHRPTFVPAMQMVMVVAIVLAIGASFADPDASSFAMAVYDKVKGWILNVRKRETEESPCIRRLMVDVVRSLRSSPPIVPMLLRSNSSSSPTSLERCGLPGLSWRAHS